MKPSKTYWNPVKPNQTPSNPVKPSKTHWSPLKPIEKPFETQYNPVKLGKTTVKAGVTGFFRYRVFLARNEAQHVHAADGKAILSRRRPGRRDAIAIVYF